MRRVRMVFLAGGNVGTAIEVGSNMAPNRIKVRERPKAPEIEIL